LTDDRSGNIHPRERRGEEETLRQGRERLGLELLGDDFEGVTDTGDGGGRGGFGHDDVLRGVRSDDSVTLGVDGVDSVHVHVRVHPGIYIIYTQKKNYSGSGKSSSSVRIIFVYFRTSVIPLGASMMFTSVSSSSESESDDEESSKMALKESL